MKGPHVDHARGSQVVSRSSRSSQSSLVMRRETSRSVKTCIKAYYALAIEIGIWIGLDRGIRTIFRLAAAILSIESHESQVGESRSLDARGTRLKSACFSIEKRYSLTSGLQLLKNDDSVRSIKYAFSKMSSLHDAAHLPKIFPSNFRPELHN